MEKFQKSYTGVVSDEVRYILDKYIDDNKKSIAKEMRMLSHSRPANENLSFPYRDYLSWRDAKHQVPFSCHDGEEHKNNPEKGGAPNISSLANLDALIEVE